MASEPPIGKTSGSYKPGESGKPGGSGKAGEAARTSAAPFADRNVYGPRPIGAFIPAVARPAYKKRSPATATLLTEWERIVGPALNAVTTPRRLSADSLTIACAGPVAMELQHLAPVLIERINGHFGRPLVQQLRFVQDGVAPAGPAPPPRKQPTSAMIEAADRAVADLPPGDLRDALASLGRAILAERGLSWTSRDETG